MIRANVGALIFTTMEVRCKCPNFSNRLLIASAAPAVIARRQMTAIGPIAADPTCPYVGRYRSQCGPEKVHKLKLKLSVHEPNAFPPQLRTTLKIGWRERPYRRAPAKFRCPELGNRPAGITRADFLEAALQNLWQLLDFPSNTKCSGAQNNSPPRPLHAFASPSQRKATKVVHFASMIHRRIIA